LITSGNIKAQINKQIVDMRITPPTVITVISGSPAIIMLRSVMTQYNIFEMILSRWQHHSYVPYPGDRPDVFREKQIKPGILVCL